MNTQKVRVVELVHTTVQERVENITEGDISVTAMVTRQNGVVTAIDSIKARDASAPDTAPLWEGHAYPNVQGFFNISGREMEVFAAVMDFVDAVRYTEPEDDGAQNENV